MKPTLLFAIGALLVAGGTGMMYLPAGVIVAGFFALGGSALHAFAEIARARRTGDAELEARPELAEAQAA